MEITLHFNLAVEHWQLVIDNLNLIVGTLGHSPILPVTSKAKTIGFSVSEDIVSSPTVYVLGSSDLLSLVYFPTTSLPYEPMLAGITSRS
jgi:hypothetical protein